MDPASPWNRTAADSGKPGSPMTDLNDIRKGVRLQGVIPNRPVEVVTADLIGDQVLNLVYRNPDGGLAEIAIDRDDLSRLSIEARNRTWAFDGDAARLRLVAEAERIALAHHFDPYLAVHTSLIDPLPHQISAVYGEMLSRQPLRFLLADDPGAGKTIMAGLLIKELIARGDLERCLIVAPGSLVEQWQDELGEKFGLEFEILTREGIESSRSGNPLDDRNRWIARLDMLARNDDLQAKLDQAGEWDLIVCDEAHRMSASWFGSEVDYTKRYRLGQKLGERCRHFLLMTATPHNGKEPDFQLFMALLDPDRFEGKFRDGDQRTDAADLMRRLTKEDLLRFDTRPLFPERRAYTARYELSPEETALYEAVTDYVRTEMNRVRRFAEQDGQKSNNVGFALQVLQRRLASSPAAIHESLRRRRERLESELAGAERDVRLGRTRVAEDALDELEEYGQEEVDEIEEELVSRATTAKTVEELGKEVATLQVLERQALGVLRSGRDTKWTQLDRILDDPLMTDGSGHRRKLIVFTEARDTLRYLEDRIRSRLGRPEAVATIHGGVRREERRKTIERFMADPELLVLVANDAAGEGVNLQRAHLMVNYDLPWNPNRIEQRFGRIHRIGQTEVCHLWNLVAAETREGQVYARLLEKLDAAREALGGRVYDVLGELFEGTALKDLLIEAIEYGERPDVKARLFERVDVAGEHDRILELLQTRSLTNDAMPEARVEEMRIRMEQAEAQRLQPCHVQSFFVEAFRRLGGRIEEREEGRWEIRNVPAELRDRRTGGTIQRRYERICFEKHRIGEQPAAVFVYPGHSLLDAVISGVRDRYGSLMRQGAVFVRDSDSGMEPSAVVLMEHEVQDGRTTAAGKPVVVSRKLQFASIGPDGKVWDAGIAPHLDLRPADPEEIGLVADLPDSEWLGVDLERTAVEFATVEMARNHVREVRERALPKIEKVEREVWARLTTGISHWDARANELRERERQGKRTRLSSENAERRAADLAERRKRRMELLELEKNISARPPRVRGGLLVVPKGLLEARRPDRPDRPSVDAEARRAVEIAAMEAVMAAERRLGNEPTDVSARKIGYDVESYDPETRGLRFIEVKGRAEGRSNVTFYRTEIVLSLHEPEKFILAFVEVTNGVASEPRYVRGALDEREPPFDQEAITFNLNRLLQRAEAPA